MTQQHIEQQRTGTRRHPVRRPGHGQAGFSFFEVLIAALILGIGVLGFAALQVRALDTTGVSHFRAQAAVLAADLSERMRMAVADQTTAQILATWGAITAIPATLPTGTDTCMSTVAAVGGCTPAELVAADVRELRFLADQLLPAGNVDVRACDVGSELICVFIAWRGQQSVDCEAGDGNPDCLSLQVLF